MKPLNLAIAAGVLFALAGFLKSSEELAALDSSAWWSIGFGLGIVFLIAGAVSGHLHVSTGFAILVAVLVASVALTNAGIINGQAWESEEGETGPQAGGLMASCAAGGIPTIWLPGANMVTVPVGCAVGVGTYLWFN